MMDVGRDGPALAAVGMPRKLNRPRRVPASVIATRPSAHTPTVGSSPVLAVVLRAFPVGDSDEGTAVDMAYGRRSIHGVAKAGALAGQNEPAKAAGERG
jgi:hypothetical protein